jgi:4-alpha-glucanotransferase
MAETKDGSAVADQRHSGLLLHFTSLPGPGGVGDLGPEAHRFLGQLARGGQRAWQVLPIGPTGFGDSPYQTASVLAGNPLLLSMDALCESGLLDAADLRAAPPASARADYGAALAFKRPLLQKACVRLQAAQHGLATGTSADLSALGRDFAAYCAAEREWLDEYALFMAIKEECNQRPWMQWPAPLRDREPAALAQAQTRLAQSCALHRFIQWQFERQFGALRSAAKSAGIELIGDVPIFVAHDSVEVWSGRSQFLLHPDGQLRVQAGVPPDYFSKTGQLWGNPLYDWPQMEQGGFAFWKRRVARAGRLFDRVRIDHFRGFAAHWEVPGAARTAEIGRWVPAPGHALFTALREHKETAQVRFIAEDLGVITDDVEALRDHFAFPGIRVLQFGFGEDDNYDGRPWAFRRNLVVYTSTHDNATIVGWYRGEPDGTRTAAQAAQERDKVNDYMGHNPSPDYVHFALIRLALATVADTVIIPVQDVLGLGNQARMNSPGVPEGNWQYRLLDGQLSENHLEHLRHLTKLYGRGSGA